MRVRTITKFDSPEESRLWVARMNEQGLTDHCLSIAARQYRELGLIQDAERCESKRSAPCRCIHCRKINSRGKPKSAFTLIELLIVIVIILGVSAVAIPAIVWSTSDWQLTASAQRIQSAIALARSAAMRDGQPHGIRLLVDKSVYPDFKDVNGVLVSSYPIDVNLPLASSSWIPLETPPAYSEGLVSIYPYDVANPFPLALPSPVLVLEQSIRDASGLLASPTGWFWQIRVGDRIRIGSGRYYTVVGPIVDSSPEQFVNIGPPGTISSLDRGDGPEEYLFLVNGRDDDGNGYIDDGYNGVTQSFNSGYYETETWDSALAMGAKAVPYQAIRRPVPSATLPVEQLPSNVVIDLTGWATTQTRSRLPVNAQNGQVDLMFDRQGRLILAMTFSSPDSVSLDGQWLHFWLVNRSSCGVDTALPSSSEAKLLTVNGKTGHAVVADVANQVDPFTLSRQN